MIEFLGTIKVHGTNAGAVYNSRTGLYAQSRGRTITPQDDNYDFAKFVQANHDSIKIIMVKIILAHGLQATMLEDPNFLFVIYGEFCCDNIQARIALTGLKPKKWIIYDAALIDLRACEQEKQPQGGQRADVIYPSKKSWLNIVCLEGAKGSAGMEDIFDVEHEIYNIGTFGTYHLVADLDDLEPTRAQIAKITDAVEQECPIGRYFGRRKENGDCTVGEGVVWRISKISLTNLPDEEIDPTDYPNMPRCFKHKGELHATNTKTVSVPLNATPAADIADFINSVVTEERLLQGVSEVLGPISAQRDGGIDKSAFKKIGEFLRWVNADIEKEDLDCAPPGCICTDARSVHTGKLDKETHRIISDKARRWFKKYLNEHI